MKCILILKIDVIKIYTTLFTMSSSASSVQIQATFTLENVVDGKQRFSLENLYIILPEHIESVQGNKMEFLFKHSSAETNETVTTPVKPIQKVIPSAPVKEHHTNSYARNLSTSVRKIIDSALPLEITTDKLDLFLQCATKRGLSVTKNDKSGQGINYNNFLKFRNSATSLDKPLQDQINDYLYSHYAYPSMELPNKHEASRDLFNEREDYLRLSLLRDLFNTKGFQWEHEYFAVYKEWSTKFVAPHGSNRYKKMMKFLDEHHSLFKSF